MTDEIRELLSPASAESRLRAAALSFRSLLEHNDGASMTLTREDGYELAYRTGEGFELRDPVGEVIATYPEALLDDERWAPAKWTAPVEANSAA